MTLPYHRPLFADDLRALGIPEPYVMGRADRVRYAELDPLDHANNTAYFRWFEAVRIHYVRDLGITRYRIGIDPRLVIASTACTFLAEMTQDEDFVCACRTSRYGRSSFTMEYAVYVLSQGAPDLRATGEAAAVIRTPDGSAPHPIPEGVLRIMQERDGATPR